MKSNRNYLEGGPRKNTFSARQGRGGRVRSAIKSDTPVHSVKEDKNEKGIGQRKTWKYLGENCYHCIKYSVN